MRTHFLKAALIIAITLFFSCSKDDEATPTPEPTAIVTPLQDPLPGFLQASELNQMSSQVNTANQEYGLSFSPLVNGKITAIVVKIPDTRNGLRVTIWDKATSSVLRTESIDIVTANTETTKQIVPINLEQFKDYIISINTNDYYLRRKSNQSAISYPFIIGDIKITSFNYLSLGTDQVMPSLIFYNEIQGDFSFKFQK